MAVSLDWKLQPVVVREQGLVGTLFLPSTAPPYPVVITVGGSGGGIFSAPGALLASSGIAALVVSNCSIRFLNRPTSTA